MTEDKSSELTLFMFRSLLQILNMPGLSIKKKKKKV